MLNNNILRIPPSLPIGVWTLDQFTFCLSLLLRRNFVFPAPIAFKRRLLPTCTSATWSSQDGPPRLLQLEGQGAATHTTSRKGAGKPLSVMKAAAAALVPVGRGRWNHSCLSTIQCRYVPSTGARAWNDAVECATPMSAMHCPGSTRCLDLKIRLGVLDE